LIISHSMLLYWWPVWAIGLLLFVLTVIDGTRLAVVPPDTVAYTGAEVKVGEAGKETTYRDRDILMAPQDKHLPPYPDGKPYLRIANHSSYGILFATTLVLVIFITNVPLRGLWSAFVILGIILLVVIFAYFQLWDAIFRHLSHLDLRINAGSYLFIAGILLILWILVVGIFDRRVYMLFTPGQFRVCEEVGGGETTYDTMGMVVQKQRDDWFRHIFLGAGSGDLIVRTSGAHAREFHMPNVTFIDRKLKRIEELQADKPVVASGTTK